MFDLIETISDLLGRIDEGRAAARETQKASDDFNTACAERDNALELSQELLYKVRAMKEEDPARSQAMADYEHQRAKYEKLKGESDSLCVQFQETNAFFDAFGKELFLLLERLPLGPDWDVSRPAVRSLNVSHWGAWIDSPTSPDLATLEIRLTQMRDLAIRTLRAGARRIDPFPTPDDANWNDMSITFVSEHRVRIAVLTVTQTRSYAEMGFEDQRGGGGKPDSAWACLKVLAQSAGRIERPAELKRPGWPKVEKQVQAVRARLKEIFGIPGDPLPFRKPGGYQAQFKIEVRKSYHH